MLQKSTQGKTQKDIKKNQRKQNATDQAEGEKQLYENSYDASNAE
jgi:CRISPR/Cas system-associated protein Cas5 (RAMP superfamily)